MAISIATGAWRDHYPDDRSAMGAFAELIHRLLTEGISEPLRQQYADFRELILDNPEYVDVVPPVLRRSRTADQFRAGLASSGPDDDLRVAAAMTQLREMFIRAEELSVPQAVRGGEGASTNGGPRVAEDGSLRVTEDGSERVPEDGNALGSESGRAHSCGGSAQLSPPGSTELVAVEEQLTGISELSKGGAI